MEQEVVAGYANEAILLRRGLTIVHVKDDGEVTTRDVLPFWVTRGKLGWYIIGYDRLRNAKRSFRADRITSIKVRDIEVAVEGYKFIGRRHNLLRQPMRAFAGVFKATCDGNHCNQCLNHGDCSAEGQM